MNTADQPRPRPRPAPTRRTVPLTSRPAETRPHPEPAQTADQLDDQLDDGGGYWRARRRAGRRLFALAALAVGVQVVGLLLPEDRRTLESVLLVSPYPALLLAAGVLMPRPPAGFFRGWRSPRPPHPADGGPDAFVFAVIAATLVPQQVLTFWLPSDAPDILAALTPTLGSFGLGIVLLLVAVGLRERQHRHRARGRVAAARDTD